MSAEQPGVFDRIRQWVAPRQTPENIDPPNSHLQDEPPPWSPDSPIPKVDLKLSDPELESLHESEHQARMRVIRAGNGAEELTRLRARLTDPSTTAADVAQIEQSIAVLKGNPDVQQWFGVDQLVLQLSQAIDEATRAKERNAEQYDSPDFASFIADQEAGNHAGENSGYWKRLASIHERFAESEQRLHRATALRNAIVKHPFDRDAVAAAEQFLGHFVPVGAEPIADPTPRVAEYEADGIVSRPLREIERPDGIRTLLDTIHREKRGSKAKIAARDQLRTRLEGEFDTSYDLLLRYQQSLMDRYGQKNLRDLPWDRPSETIDALELLFDPAAPTTPARRFRAERFLGLVEPPTFRSNERAARFARRLAIVTELHALRSQLAASLNPDQALLRRLDRQLKPPSVISVEPPELASADRVPPLNPLAPPPAFAPFPLPPAPVAPVTEPTVEPSERVDIPVLSESLTASNWAEVIDRAYGPLAERASELSHEELKHALHAIRAETEALKARDPAFTSTADHINAEVMWAVDKWEQFQSLATTQERQDKVRQWWRSIDRFVFNLDKVSFGSSALNTLLISALLDVDMDLRNGKYDLTVERIAIWRGQPFVTGVIERDTKTTPQPAPPDHPDWSGKVAGWPEPGNGGLKINGEVLIFAKQPYYA